MVAVAVTGVVVGFLLGLRFRVFVLLPVQIAALAVALTAATTTSLGFGFTLLAFAACCACLQAGYLVASATPVLLRRVTVARHVRA